MAKESQHSPSVTVAQPPLQPGGKYGLTGKELKYSNAIRQQQLYNVLKLRREYNRYVKNRGWKSPAHNPFIPLGFGTVMFSLIYSMVKARDAKVNATMLSWRVHAQVFTIVAIMGGYGSHKYFENRWVKQQALERNMQIDIGDLWRSPADLRFLINELSSK